MSDEQPKTIVCPCCGTYRLKPKMPQVHEVPWSDACSCTDMKPCVAHAMNPYGDVPPRPNDAALAAKAERMYVELLKEHMRVMSRFHWLEKKLKEWEDK